MRCSTAAERGELSDPAELDRQVRRMLADPRAEALVENFAGQWLYLRNLTGTRPDPPTFPDFDDNLRQSLRRETELFFTSIMQENRSVLDLLTADYTFLNERLARHYGIPGDLRRPLPPRAGDRRSPPRPARPRERPDRDVLRDAHLARPAREVGSREPARRAAARRRRPNVPDLEDTASAEGLSIRERLVKHRANPACAACHARMDPYGFGLENFDAIGRWRDTEGRRQADRRLGHAARRHVVQRTERAAGGDPAAARRNSSKTFTRKLLTYAVGRGLESSRRADRQADRESGGARRIPVLVDHRRDRHERAVPDESETAERQSASRAAAYVASGLAVDVGTTRSERKHDHHEDGAASADVPARRWRRGRVAAPRRDGAGPVRPVANRRRPCPPARVRLHPERRHHGAVDACGRREGVRALADPEVARGAPRSVVVVSNLDSRPAEAAEGEGSGDHARASAVWLTGVHPKRTEGADVRGGKTIDQIAADVLGRDTQLRSLEIAAEDFTAVGGCDIGYACSYVNTLSWRTPTTPLPMQTDPRVVFERLFGEGLGAEQRRRQLTPGSEHPRRDRRPGGAAAEAARRGRHGARHRVPRQRARGRAARAEDGGAASVSTSPFPSMPVGVPDLYDDHVKLMYDLLALAFQADVTRVSTFMLAREASTRTYSHIGVPDPHHAISHHGNAPDKIEKHAKINTYHVEPVRSLPRSAALDARRRRHAARSLAASCTAAASATAISTRTGRCRRCWRAAPAAS